MIERERDSSLHRHSLHLLSARHRHIAAIRRGVYEDPAVYANDIVVVGDSPQRRLFRDFVSLSPLLAGPLIAILQR